MLGVLFFLPALSIPLIYKAIYKLRTRRIYLHLIQGLIPLINIILLFPAFGITKTWAIGSFEVFYLDKYAWLFLMLINLGWIITLIYSYSFTRYNFRNQQDRFYMMMAQVLVCTMGSALAGNLIVMFIFYVAGILLTYPLVKFRGTNEAKDSAIFYLKSTLGPAFLIFLPALIGVIYLGGFHNFSDGHLTGLVAHETISSFLLVCFVIGISQNAVMPFHKWLPMTAISPAPVSALIHSIAAVKTGSIAILKIAVYVYGLPFLHELTSHIFPGNLLFYLLGTTAVIAAWKALKTPNLKMRFAYSTVSQLAYIITAILVATPISIMAAVLHVITHSFSKWDCSL